MIIIVNEANIVFRITNLQHIYDNLFTNLYGNIIKIKIIDNTEPLDFFFRNLPVTIKELTLKQCNIEIFPNINPELEIETLDMSLNKIVHLPDLSNYIHLKNLVLHSNLITSIISFPPNIERLDISNNKLVSIDNYPETLNYFDFSSNLILFRPSFLDPRNTNIELLYNNNIFNIIPNNYEESSTPLLPEQNILFSENFNNNFDNENFNNNTNNQNNDITNMFPFPFSFSIEYEVLENNDDFTEINLEEIDNEEIIINNPYKEFTDKINEYLRNTDDKIMDIPNEYFCPISKEIMLEPVVIRDGYTYEKKSIKEWFKYSNKSPITSKMVRNKIYLNNTSLRNMIREWIDKHKNLIE